MLVEVRRGRCAIRKSTWDILKAVGLTLFPGLYCRVVGGGCPASTTLGRKDRANVDKFQH